MKDKPLRVRTPLFIIPSKYEQAEQRRKEREEQFSSRSTFVIALVLAGAIAAFSQCNSVDENPPPETDRAEQLD